MPFAQKALPYPPHRNAGLFSDHYLNVILPAEPAWNALAEEAVAKMAEIAAIRAQYIPSEDERQTEEGFIIPVLRALGFFYEVQPPLSTPFGTKKPDYVFYRDNETLVANKGRTLTDALPAQGGYAVGDAKYWGRPLDVTIGKRQSNVLSDNPAFQIAFYVQHSGAEWGILTNGRLWRLVHRDSAQKLDVY